MQENIIPVSCQAYFRISEIIRIYGNNFYAIINLE